MVGKCVCFKVTVSKLRSQFSWYREQGRHSPALPHYYSPGIRGYIVIAFRYNSVNCSGYFVWGQVWCRNALCLLISSKKIKKDSLEIENWLAHKICRFVLKHSMWEHSCAGKSDMPVRDESEEKAGWNDNFKNSCIESQVWLQGVTCLWKFSQMLTDFPNAFTCT